MEVTYTPADSMSTVELSPQVVKKYLTSGDPEMLSEQDIVRFIQMCKHCRLNPFLRDAYLIVGKKGEPAQIIVGKDYLLKRASQNPQWGGVQFGVVIQSAANAELVYREGGILIPKETLLGGWAKGYRKDWPQPAMVAVNLKEYQQKKFDGGVVKMWHPEYGKPATMIQKVAIAQVLRILFPEELRGLYGPEEMGVLDVLPDDDVQLKNIAVTAAKPVDIKTTPPEQPTQPTPPEQPEQPESQYDAAQAIFATQTKKAAPAAPQTKKAAPAAPAAPPASPALAVFTLGGPAEIVANCCFRPGEMPNGEVYMLGAHAKQDFTAAFAALKNGEYAAEIAPLSAAAESKIILSSAQNSYPKFWLQALPVKRPCSPCPPKEKEPEGAQCLSFKLSAPEAGAGETAGRYCRLAMLMPGGEVVAVGVEKDSPYLGEYAALSGGRESLYEGSLVPAEPEKFISGALSAASQYDKVKHYRLAGQAGVLVAV
jgi:phage recombination protein Bet